MNRKDVSNVLYYGGLGVMVVSIGLHGTLGWVLFGVGLSMELLGIATGWNE